MRRLLIGRLVPLLLLLAGVSLGQPMIAQAAPGTFTLQDTGTTVQGCVQGGTDVTIFLITEAVGAGPSGPPVPTGPGLYTACWSNLSRSNSAAAGPYRAIVFALAAVEADLDYAEPQTGAFFATANLAEWSSMEASGANWAPATNLPGGFTFQVSIEHVQWSTTLVYSESAVCGAAACALPGSTMTAPDLNFTGSAAATIRVYAGTTLLVERNQWVGMGQHTGC